MLGMSKESTCTGISPTLTAIVASAVVSGVRGWTDTGPIGTVPIVVANEAVVEAAKLNLCTEIRTVI